METNVKVKLSVYKDYLVIETVDSDKAHPDFVPCGDGRIGCVLMDTAKNLGVSKEAIKWLKENVKRSHDDLGDVDAFKADDKRYVFAWLGGLYGIKEKGCEGSSTYDANNMPYIEIPNETPKGAKDAIDKF